MMQVGEKVSKKFVFEKKFQKAGRRKKKKPVGVS